MEMVMTILSVQVYFFSKVYAVGYTNFCYTNVAYVEIHVDKHKID